MDVDYAQVPPSHNGDLRGRLRQTDCALPSRSHEYRSADAAAAYVRKQNLPGLGKPPRVVLLVRESGSRARVGVAIELGTYA
jgi:hypothetical protein